MRFIALAILLVMAAFECQTGSSETTELAPSFRKVHELDGLKSEPERHLTSLRVMTWNIDHGENVAKIAGEIEETKIDLALLQEVDLRTARANNQDVAAELAHRLQLDGSFGVEFEELSQESGAPAYIGQATLTRLPIRHSRILRFERQSGYWKPRSWLPSSVPLLQRRIGNRIALVSDLEFRGKLLVVYNAHLESRSAGPIQEKQLDEILKDAAQYPAGTAILLGGDLNTKYLPSFFLHKLEAAGFHSALGEQIQRTHKIAMALDWIFAKGPVGFSEGAVRRDLNGSDHYPVSAVLRDIGNRPA